MLRLSFNMIVADMKRLFRGAYWMLPILIIIAAIIPFIEDIQLYAMTYIIMMTIAMFCPRFSRIHYVVPLSEKQIKQLFVLRVIIVCAFMLLIGIIVTIICGCMGWNWNKNAFMVIAFYLVVYIALSETGLQGFKEKRSFEVHYIVGIVGAIISILIAAGLLRDIVSYVWENVVAFGLVIFFIGYMLFYVKNIKFGDFTYVPLGFLDNGIVEKK